jgi:hypothetical protein
VTSNSGDKWKKVVASVPVERERCGVFNPERLSIIVKSDTTDWHAGRNIGAHIDAWGLRQIDHAAIGQDTNREVRIGINES